MYLKKSFYPTSQLHTHTHTHTNLQLKNDQGLHQKPLQHDIQMTTKHEQMLNITIITEIQYGTTKKKKKEKNLNKCWCGYEDTEIMCLLAGFQNSAITIKTVLRFLKKLRREPPYDPITQLISISKLIESNLKKSCNPKESKAEWMRYMHIHVHSSSVHRSHEVERTHMSVDGSMDKH